MFPRTRLLNFGRHFSRQTRSLATGSGATASIAPNLPRPRLALLGGSCLALLMWTVPIASCAHTEEGVEEGKSSDPPGADKLPAGSDEIEKFLRITVYPVCNKLGFGGIMGFCSGIAVKRIGEHVAYMVGIAFIGLQFAQYKGLVDIDWLQVRDAAVTILDADGDGEITAKDLAIYWRQARGVLEHAVPSAGGFAGGMVLGLWYA